jgi:hypothetical protein
MFGALCFYFVTLQPSIMFSGLQCFAMYIMNHYMLEQSIKQAIPSISQLAGPLSQLNSATPAQLMSAAEG